MGVIKRFFNDISEAIKLAGAGKEYIEKRHEAISDIKNALKPYGIENLLDGEESLNSLIDKITRMKLEKKPYEIKVTDKTKKVNNGWYLVASKINLEGVEKYHSGCITKREDIPKDYYYARVLVKNQI